MNKDEIKKLAKLTLSQNRVDKKIADYVLGKLARRELAMYLRYLKSLLAKNSVVILSEKPLPSQAKAKLTRLFTEKDVSFELSPEIGDGIKVIIGDTIIDLSLAGYVDSAVVKLKQEL